LRFLKPKSKRTPIAKSEKNCGAYFDIDPDSGRVDQVIICALNDQAEHIVIGTLARIIRPNCFYWIRRLMSRARAMF
jgi:hypothetical protein